MGDANRNKCVFRQLISDPEAKPTSVTRVGEFLRVPKTLGEAAEMYAAVVAPVCDVQGCNLSIQALMRYVGTPGDGPQQELDKMVAPSCEILDIPHSAEEDLGPYLYPDDPRTT